MLKGDKSLNPTYTNHNNVKYYQIFFCKSISKQMTMKFFNFSQVVFPGLFSERCQLMCVIQPMKCDLNHLPDLNNVRAWNNFYKIFKQGYIFYLLSAKMEVSKNEKLKENNLLNISAAVFTVVKHIYLILIWIKYEIVQDKTKKRKCLTLTPQNLV